MNNAWSDFFYSAGFVDDMYRDQKEKRYQSNSDKDKYKHEEGMS